MSADATDKFVDQLNAAEMKLPPAEVVLHFVNGDVSSGPIEWVNNRIDYSFPVTPGQIVKGWTIYNYGDRTIPIYHSDHYRKIPAKDKTYSMSLSIDIIPEKVADVRH